MKPSPAWPWSCLRRWKGRASGNPCFRGTGVSVEFVYSRWLAGESIDELAEDYELHPSLIEQGFREWSGRPRDWKKRVQVIA